MDEKIQNALLTSDEKSYVKRIKELEQIVDAQKVTEQILVAELEKLKTQIILLILLKPTHIQQFQVNGKQ